MKKVNLIDLEPLFRDGEEEKLEKDPLFISLHNNLNKRSDALEVT